jgi:hypothetical protein
MCSSRSTHHGNESSVAVPTPNGAPKVLADEGSSRTRPESSSPVASKTATFTPTKDRKSKSGGPGTLQ